LDDAGAFDQVRSDRGGEGTVDREDHESHHHEHGAEADHPGQIVRVVARDELRQESEEEDRQFGVEQVAQNCRLNNLSRGPRG
jgi:hypothetical protein